MVWFRMKSCMQTITTGLPSRWQADPSNTSMHALHGTSFRRSSASFKVHSQGDSLFDELTAKWRYESSLHKSAKPSPETKVEDVAQVLLKEVVDLTARCMSGPTTRDKSATRRPSAKSVPSRMDGPSATTLRFRTSIRAVISVVCRRHVPQNWRITGL